MLLHLAKPTVKNEIAFNIYEVISLFRVLFTEDVHVIQRSIYFLLHLICLLLQVSSSIENSEFE